MNVSVVNGNFAIGCLDARTSGCLVPVNSSGHDELLPMVQKTSSTEKPNGLIHYQVDCRKLQIAARVTMATFEEVGVA